MKEVTRMKKKRAAAWILAGSMVLSNSSFQVLAEEYVVDVQEVVEAETGAPETTVSEAEISETEVLETDPYGTEITEEESSETEAMGTEMTEADLSENETNLSETEMMESEQIIGDSEYDFLEDVSIDAAADDEVPAQYEVSVWSDFEIGQMLPGMNTTLHSDTQCGELNENGDWEWQEVTAYYTWAAEEIDPAEERQCPVTITPQESDNSACDVEVPDDVTDYAVRVTCTAYEDAEKTKELGFGYMELYICDGFYKIDLKNRETLENLQPGQSAELDASLLFYDAENEDEGYSTVDKDIVWEVEDELLEIGNGNIKRIANGDIWPEIRAKVDGEVVATTLLHMPSYNYDIWFEKARDDGWTWIFDNEESYTLFVNTENLTDKENASVTWKIGRWNEETESLEDVLDNTNSSYYQTDDAEITLNGKELAEKYPAGTEEGWFHVQAEVYAGDVCVNSCLMYVEVWRPVYDYQYPLSEPGDNTMLRGWKIRIDNRMNVWAQDGAHPWGEDVEIGLAVEELSQYTWDEAGNEVELTEEDDPVVRISEDENGWTFEGLRDGFIELKLICDSVEDPEEKVTYGDKADEEFRIYVNGGKANLYLDYPDRDNRMLQNSELEVWTNLDNEWLDENDDYRCEEITDYYLKIDTDEEGNPYYNTDLVTVEIKDNTKVLVKSKEKTGGGSVCILAMDPETDEEISRANLYYEVCDSYYRIIFRDAEGNKVEPENPILGDTLDLNDYDITILYQDKDHTWDDPGELTVEEKNDFRVSLVDRDEGGYNSEVLELVVSEDDTKKYPVLKRIRTDGTHLQLAVEHRERDKDGNICYDDQGSEIWYEWGRNEWYLDGYDYSTYFADVRDEEHDCSFIFSNEDDYTLSLDTDNLMEGDNLREGVAIEWKIGIWDEDSETLEDELKNTDNQYYTANGTTITLHGSALAGVYKPGENSWFTLEAHVKVNGYEVSGCGIGVEVCDPEYNYEFPLNGVNQNELLPGWKTAFSSEMNCWVRDKAHPNGEDVTVSISKAEILGYGEEFNWDKYQKGEEQEYDDIEPIGTFEGDAENGWVFTASEGNEDGYQYGYAYLQITYTGVEDGKTKTFEIPIFVGNQRYELNYSYPKGVDWMVTNDEMTVETSLYAYMIKDDGEYWEGNISGYNVRVTDDDGNPCYDTNLITAEVVDGTKIRITSNGQCGDTSIWTGAIGADIDGTPDLWLTGNYINVNVGEGYSYMTPLEIGSNPLIAQALDLNELNLKVFDKSVENDPVELEGIRYTVEYDKDVWEEKESNKGDLPQLIRNKRDATEITLIAEQDCSDDGSGDWQEIIRRSYWFDNVWDQYSVGFEYSYGTYTDDPENETSRALTDIPLVLTFHELEMNGLKDYEIEWDVYWWDDETQQEIRIPERLGVEYTISEDGKSIELLGKENHIGQYTDVLATVLYKGNKVIELWTHVMTDSCEHDWDKGTVTKEQSCTEDGKLVKTCAECGAQKTETLPKKGHNMSAWSVVSKATVFKAEQQKRTCKNGCGHVETKSVGSKLKATYKLTASSITLKTKQSTSDFTITGLANGDSIKSISLDSTKYVELSNVNLKKGTFTLKALKKKGTAKLRITLASGKIPDVSIKIQTGDVKTTKVTGVASKLTLAKGQKLTLKPGREPFTSKQKFTYSTSSKSVVKVTSSGQLTAVAPGTAKITVKSGSKKATCTVTVPGIAGVKSSVTLKKKKSTTLKPKLYGISGKATFISSNPTVATVNASGKVTGVSKGTATITIKAGSYTVSCKVKVK